MASIGVRVFISVIRSFSATSSASLDAIEENKSTPVSDLLFAVRALDAVPSLGADTLFPASISERITFALSITSFGIPASLATSIP